MSIYISLLRGINVGGQKKLSMETLREICQGLGFRQIRTYLQSGNVIFESAVANLELLTQQIEVQIAQTCGYAVQAVVRQVDELQCIVRDNPFLRDSDINASKLHVSFLYRQPSESAWSKVVIPTNIADQFARGESVIYLYYPNGYAKARIPASFFEKRLSVPLTDRNWNTATALYNIAVEMKATLKESNPGAA